MDTFKCNYFNKTVKKVVQDKTVITL